MNLARHAAVLWRFRKITAMGVLLGIMLAILAAYRVTFDGGLSLVPRGTEIWVSTSSLLVTQPGFPEGRVTLPEKQLDSAAGGVTSDGRPAVAGDASPADQLQFADPARLSGLADLYSKFLTSDMVLRRGGVGIPPQMVSASPFSASSGGQVLPVIQLQTRAPTRALAGRSNVAVVKALRDVLAEGQSANRIAKAGRVEVRMLNSPAVALESGRKPTASILILMLSLLGTLAVTHLLAALRARQEQLPHDPFLESEPGAVVMTQNGAGHTGVGHDAGVFSGAPHERIP